MKNERLFEMLIMLLNKETISAKTFASHFMVSVRTIYRYVDTLALANIPIYTKKGKNGGISLLPEYTLNKTFLSEKKRLKS